MYIVHLLTSWGTPYNHQSNPIERFHKTIRSLLKAKKPIRKNDWEKRLPTLILAYNANQHYSTLCSPARLFLCHIYHFSQSSNWNHCTQFRCLYCAQFLRNCAQGLAISHRLNPNALETLLLHRLRAICNCVSMSRVLFSDKTYLAFTIFYNNQKLFFQKYH